MAVYTTLSPDFVRFMLGVYPQVGELLDLEGIAAGSTNTSYRVRTTRGTFFLRVNEGKPFRALLHERDLLVFLRGRADALGGLETPTLMENGAGGVFFPVPQAWAGAEQKYASLFRALGGTEPAPGTWEAPACAALGRALATTHLALRRFRGGRPNPFGLPILQHWGEVLGRQPDAEGFARECRGALVWVARRRRPLPRGLVHGDVFPNNTRWEGERLHSIFDWEMAGRDHLLLDVAIAINAWCWSTEAPLAGTFDRARVSALLEGYRQVRPLSPRELRQLPVEGALAALRFALSRARDFGWGPQPAESVGAPGGVPARQRDFLDAREYIARLRVWRRAGVSLT